MRLNLLKEKRILILGLGREGESSFNFLRKKFPKKIIGLADQKDLNSLSKKFLQKIKNDKNLKLHLGNDYVKDLKNYDIIIKSPGIPQKLIKPYISKKQVITSQTDIFLEKHRDKVIGVTGTKGKSTTSKLIYHILKNSGLKTKLLGNIGRPALDFFDTKSDYFVYELSSHQLQNLKVSPHIAVFLNIFQEHLDYYKNFQEYFNAKKNIFRWQKPNDFFVVNIDNPLLNKIIKKAKSQIIPISLKKNTKNGCYIKNEELFFSSEKIITKEEIPMFLKPYIYNVMAAVSVAKILGISNNVIKKSLKTFTPLKHRLEFVGNYNKIKFYNDSLATIPEATILALQTLNKVDTLILGGYDRKQNFNQLIAMLPKYKVKNLILFPDTSNRIIKILKEKKLSDIKVFLAQNMKEAVSYAFKNTKNNGICLLSPAAASFNLFKDYQHRGNLFKKYVKQFYYEKKRKA